MQEHSQHSKAAALGALRRRFQAAIKQARPEQRGMAAEVDAPQLSTNVLQLLSLLARRPLTSAYKETPELMALLLAPVHGAAGSRRPAAAPAARSARDDDSSSPRGSASEGDEFDPWEASSDLSDWDGRRSDGGETASPSSPPPGDATDLQPAAGLAGPPGPSMLQAHSQAVAASILQRRGRSAAAAAITPVREMLPQLVQTQAGDLLPSLMAARYAHAPYLAPDASRWGGAHGGARLAGREGGGAGGGCHAD
jgi:hypothetical protein